MTYDSFRKVKQPGRKYSRTIAPDTIVQDSRSALKLICKVYNIRIPLHISILAAGIPNTQFDGLPVYEVKYSDFNIYIYIYIYTYFIL